MFQYWPVKAISVPSSRVTLYAPGERITFPGRLEPSAFLLVDGELTEAASNFRSAADESLMPGGDAALNHLSRRVALQHIIQRLAERIGPYAEHAVVAIADRVPSLGEICRIVANEIDDDLEREAFLRETNRDEEQTHRAGSLFDVTRDAAKTIVSKPFMRAVGGAAILALPAEPPAAHAATAV